MMNGKWTRWIEEEALRLGFDAVGFAKAERLIEDEQRLSAWLKQGFHGEMAYMENHFDKRLDPRLLVDGAQTVITFIKNYYPEYYTFPSSYRIARYAYGQDYHEVIRAQLNTLIAGMREQIGAIQARGFVDSAPVLERSWAVRSGLGWVGKNGNLITKKQGSYFFIATLITDLVLEPSATRVTDYCGTCTRCIDACPTDAILPDRRINGSQCISYFTIELKQSEINSHKPWSDWIFGCDICQEVCPWNRFSTATEEKQFKPIDALMNLSDDDFDRIDATAFAALFKGSPIKRSKFNGFKRNLEFVKKQKQSSE